MLLVLFPKLTYAEFDALNADAVKADGQTTDAQQADASQADAQKADGGGGTYLLTVARLELAKQSGVVKSSPSGISCGIQCSMTISPNTTVTLTAIVKSEAKFCSWMGAGLSASCDTKTVCQVNVASNMTVKAFFAKTGGLCP